MSLRNNPDGLPDYEYSDELVLQWFHNSPQARQIITGLSALDDQRRPFRRRADRSAGISDIYNMLDMFASRFQLSFAPSLKNPWLLNFPYMIIPPETGDMLFNLSTNETYTVKYVPKNRHNEFYGTVLLSTGITSPKTKERLIYHNPEGVGSAKRRLVDFFHAQPPSYVADLAASSGDTGSVRREAFTPTIVAEMRRQEPGTIGKRPFDIAKEIKPRLRETFPHPDDPKNYSVQIRGQWMDNIIRFICYDTTHRGAERLVGWLMDFISKYTWVLKRNGVQEILYWQRRADDKVQTWRDDIVGYPVEYYFRTEELHIDVVHNVRSIDIATNMGWKDSRTQTETGVDVAGGIVIGPFGERFATLFDAVHDESGNYLYGNYDIANLGFDHTG